MESEFTAEPPEKKQSILGIASLVISLVVGLLYGIVITTTVLIIGISAENTSTATLARTPSMIAVIVILVGCVMASPIGSLFGLTLGIASFYQGSTHRVFSILGTTINGVMFFITCIVIVLAVLSLRSRG
jgi:hypothetical protein